MNMKILFAVMLVGILLFGCTSQTKVDEKTEEKKNGKTNVTTTDETKTETIDITGKGFAEMVLSGIPIECEIKYKSDQPLEGLKNAKIYFKGKKFKMVLEAESEGNNVGMAVIDKDDGAIYYKFDNLDIMNAVTMGKTKCDWMMMKKSTVGVDEDTSASSLTDVPTTEGFDDANKVQLDCKPGLFGDEAFGTSGKVCDIKEILATLTVPATDGTPPLPE